ncbi:MAG: HEAT repeat domain-containing protein [Pirellulaceae bacterium]
MKSSPATSVGQAMPTAFITLASCLALVTTLTGCGKSPQSPEPAKAAKVTSPYDVRGDQSPAAPPPTLSPTPDPSNIQLVTATQSLADTLRTPPATTPPIEPYQEWDMPETAAKALGRIGRAAVPQLAQALSDPNPLVRKRAADVLARIGPDAKDAVPVLIRTLGDRDEEVRKAATRALGEIGPGAAEAVPRLIEALREPQRIDSSGGP